MEKVGYVYKYVHNTTRKWYIGSHDGSNPNYEGSGTAWFRAKQKYGIESFTKEILYEGEYFRAVEEIILTTLDAKNIINSYNLKNEALGGSFPGELNGMYGRILSKEERYKRGSAFRGKIRPDHSAKMLGENNPMHGRNDQSHGIISRAKANAGKTYEDIFGAEKAARIKAAMSKNRTGKSHKLIEKTCPYCGKIGSGPNMTRYHFNKCKDFK